MENNYILYLIMALPIFFFIKKKIDSRGIPNYAPAEAQQKMQSGSVLLDVRTEGERSRKAIKGSLHIPLHEIGTRIGELEKYRSREIICYCASGNRSVSAAIKLKKAGFTPGNLSGGIASWNFSNI